MGSTLTIVKFRVGGYPKCMDDGGSEILRTDRIGDGVGCSCIAFAVNHAASNAASGQQAAVAKRPVFSSGIVRSNLWLATEFADPSDDGFVQQAAFSKSVKSAASALSAVGSSRSSGD